MSVRRVAPALVVAFGASLGLGAAGCGDGDTGIVLSGGGFGFTSSSLLPQATRGTPYAERLRTAGGDPPVRFFIVGGSLPVGLALDRDTGEIGGTPTVAGEIADLRVQARDDRGLGVERDFRLTVAKEIEITSSSPLPAGRVGIAYATTLQVTGGSPPYGWSVVSGALPGGLTLNAQTGEVRGLPLRAETATFTVRVSDTRNPAGQVSTTESFQLTIR